MKFFALLAAIIATVLAVTHLRQRRNDAGAA